MAKIDTVQSKSFQLLPIQALQEKTLRPSYYQIK